MEEGKSFEASVAAAVEGCEGTKKLRAKLGRATYVGVGADNKELPPDPGAWGAMVAIQGLYSGSS
jgi:dihydroxyacetone kinase